MLSQSEGFVKFGLREPLSQQKLLLSTSLTEKFHSAIH